MESPAELARLIRLALDELSRENGHHTFEDLCRELAMARLVSNLLPATGPVSGGGDQGRDFETYRTYLAEGLAFSRGFLALAAADTVVFACTLQREDVKGKIKGDLTSICTQGTPVQAVYFMCAEPVRVSVRHNLQAWARAEFTVALEVLDGLAIARMLAEHDTFWIARTYLRLPANLGPEPRPGLSSAPGPGSAPVVEHPVIQAERDAMVAGRDLVINNVFHGAAPVPTRSAYLEQVRRIAPPGLLDRNAEMAELGPPRLL